MGVAHLLYVSANRRRCSWKAALGGELLLVCAVFIVKVVWISTAVPSFFSYDQQYSFKMS